MFSPLHIFLSFLSSPILFSSPKSILFSPLCLPFILLRLHSSALLISLPVSLFTLGSPARLHLLLFISVKCLSLCVVTACPKSSGHLAKFFLLRRSDAMAVRGL